jgi:hypothetical protein
MASTLKDLTRMGGDVRKLARLLQAKAPEGEMLAYINPREAALLKAYGGSGKPDEETGIPSFDDGPSDYEFSQMTDDQSVDSTIGDNFVFPVDVTTQAPSAAPSQDTTFAGFPGMDRSFESPIPERGPSAQLTGAADIEAAQRQLAPPETGEKDSLSKQLSKLTGMKEETLGRLGIAGIQGLLGSRAASAAAKEGQQGKAQIQALATPYQQKGAELQAQAQRGELTPQAMQSLQAAQAQAAQGVQARGGVGVAQATAQVEALRQQLLQQQYDYGLKLSGIGDNIALGAIKTGLEADRYVQQINNSFYQNMAYIAAGITPGSTGGGR